MGGKTMTEETARAIDGWCKIAATIGLVAGGCWTYVTWVKSATQEAQRPFFERRLEIYVETVSAVSTIATTNDPQTTGKDARAKFWTLYHGPMSLVQSPDMENAMDAIAKCLRKHCKEDDIRSLIPDL